MPLSSMDIAQMNGAFQNGAMQNMAQSGMIGQPYGHMPLGENLAGRAINMGTGVAQPLTMGMATLAGTDPISMGMRMGTFASRGLGTAGGVGVGMAGGLGMMAIGAGVQYAGHQAVVGAQQQQQFNSSMRSNFNFINPAAHGGRGFSSVDTATISSNLRSMAGAPQGPMGEMVGFEELGRLASNMGRMGMAQGVRSAKEFSGKFKEMVGALKEIATSFNTNLEEAQQMMGAMRGSGVFGAGKAAAFAKSMKMSSAASGLTTTEQTSAMNIGSQISRSIGGLGRAGAAGGLKTITDIGTAKQMGIISEEDIYNSTGLAGAEGVQAMATQQMQSAASFLKGGLGRRFLASMAGKDGTLNQGSVSAWAAGGIGTGETMRMAHENLGGVGRANFIRNVGRLRGEALAQFGGALPAMVMKSWLDQRGMSLGENNDRSMIFMQRRLGMGRDEADMMIRQIEHLPEIIQQQKLAQADVGQSERMGRQKANRGLEGLKRSFDRARETVNNKLQKAGADLYEHASDQIEAWANKMVGGYVEVYSQAAAKAVSSLNMAGDEGDRARAMVGMNGGKFKQMGSLGSSDALRKSMFGDVTTGAGSNNSNWVQKNLGIGDVLAEERGGAGWSKFGTQGEMMREMGGSLLGIGGADAQANKSLLSMGAGGAAGAVAGGWTGATAGAMVGGFVGGAVGLMFGGVGVLGGIAAGQAVGGWIGGIGGAAAGGYQGAQAGGLFSSGGAASSQALGAAMSSEESVRLRQGAFSSDEETRSKTILMMDGDVKKIEDKKKKGLTLTDTEEAQLTNLKSIKTASSAGAYADKAGKSVTSLSKDEWEKIGKANGQSGTEARAAAYAQAGTAAKDQLEAVITTADVMQKQGEDIVSGLGTKGEGEGGQLVRGAGGKLELGEEAYGEIHNQFKKNEQALGDSAFEYAQGMAKAAAFAADYKPGEFKFEGVSQGRAGSQAYAKAKAAFGPAEDARRTAHIKKWKEMQGEASAKLGGLSAADRRRAMLAAGSGGRGALVDARDEYQAAVEDSLDKAKKSPIIGEGLRVAAGFLGVRVSAKDLAAADKNGGVDSQIRLLAEASGIDFKDPKNSQYMKDFEALAKAKTPAERTDVVTRLQGSDVQKAITKVQGDKKEASDRKDNPIQALMEGHLKNIASAFGGAGQELASKIGVAVSSKDNTPPSAEKPE